MDIDDDGLITLNLVCRNEHAAVVHLLPDKHKVLVEEGKMELLSWTLMSSKSGGSYRSKLPIGRGSSQLLAAETNQLCGAQSTALNI